MNNAKNNPILFYIDGGNNAQWNQWDSNLAQLAADTQSITIQMKMVPNQPLIFPVLNLYSIVCLYKLR